MWLCFNFNVELWFCTWVVGVGGGAESNSVASKWTPTFKWEIYVCICFWIQPKMGVCWCRWLLQWLSSSKPRCPRRTFHQFINFIIDMKYKYYKNKYYFNIIATYHSWCWPLQWLHLLTRLCSRRYNLDRCNCHDQSISQSIYQSTNMLSIWKRVKAYTAAVLVGVGTGAIRFTLLRKCQS